MICGPGEAAADKARLHQPVEAGAHCNRTAVVAARRRPVDYARCTRIGSQESLTGVPRGLARCRALSGLNQRAISSALLTLIGCNRNGTSSNVSSARLYGAYQMRPAFDQALSSSLPHGGGDT